MDQNLIIARGKYIRAKMNTPFSSLQESHGNYTCKKFCDLRINMWIKIEDHNFEYQIILKDNEAEVKHQF